MGIESQLWAQGLMVLGEVTILLVLLALLLMLSVACIVFLSIKHGRFYFPRLVRVGFEFMEDIVRSLCRMMGLDDRDLTIFFIRLHNKMSENDFSKVAIEDRAIFLPHCLRSSNCPADLTPEGLSCQHCGRCDLDRSVNELEGMGYRVFIVPGSTFVRRMVEKYWPTAIIGVGCLMETKEGLEFADKFGLIAMGVVNITDGCVETLADWTELMKVASLKTPKT